MGPARPLALLALLALGLGTLALGWRAERRHEVPDGGRPAALVAARDSRALTEEAIRLYASGQFPRACERFSRAADDDPASTALRTDVGSCFEGWGWHALREGRPDEALLLFRQGLAETPESTSLLKGLGLAAVHAGRPDDAFGPLERAVRAEFDPEVLLLLAHLYDYREDPSRAIARLEAVLEREPAHAEALRLLEKIAREWRAEAGFHRDVTPRFVLKYRGAPGEDARRTILGLLDVAAERVGRALHWEPREPLTVVLYEHRQFRDVTRVHGWATGLFDGRIRLPLGQTLPPAAQLERLIVHEYAHAAVHHLSRPPAPAPALREASGALGRPDAERAGQRHAGGDRGSRRRPRSPARADGLRPGALDRARPPRPRWHRDDARAAGPAGRGRRHRRRDAPGVRAAHG